MGYKVERHQQYLSLIVNEDLEIATAIIDNMDYHSSIFYASVLTMHTIYFPQGIDENVAGYGISLEEKAGSLINNYIDTIFLTIIDGLSDTHDPNLDMNVSTDGRDILWHPTLGSMYFYGQWNEYPENELLFELIRDIITNKLSSNKINWLKIYVAKMADGNVITDCLFNNEQWDDGLDRIANYAKTWKIESDLKGIKQFIVLRRCDLYD